MKDLVASQEMILTFVIVLIAIRLACGTFENFVAVLMFMMTGGTIYILVK